MAVGRTNVACIVEDGTLFTWGKPIWGMLGYKSTTSSGNQSVPCMVEKSIGINFKQVSIGFNHVAAVTEDGKL